MRSQRRGGAQTIHPMTTRTSIASQRTCRFWPVLALAGVAFASVGCGGRAAARPMPAATEDAPVTVGLIRLAPAQPFFVPGEAMSFELSYQGILTGRASMAVGEPGQVDGRTILIVRSQFETAGAAKLLSVVRDTIDTRLDWHTGAPVEHRGEAVGRGRHILAAIRFDGRKARFEYERVGKSKVELDVTLPPGEIMHDMHTVLGALRAWEPEPGAVLYFYSASGRRVWRSELAYRGSETMRTAMGLRAALRFSGTSVRVHPRSLEPETSRPPRRIDLWISDDAHRMPLRLVAHTEIGDFQAELVSYHQPGQRVSAN